MNQSDVDLIQENQRLLEENGELKAANDAHRAGAEAAADMLNRGEKLARELTAQAKELQATGLRLAQEKEQWRLEAGLRGEIATQFRRSNVTLIEVTNRVSLANARLLDEHAKQMRLAKEAIGVLRALSDLFVKNGKVTIGDIPPRLSRRLQKLNSRGR